MECNGFFTMCEEVSGGKVQHGLSLRAGRDSSSAFRGILLSREYRLGGEIDVLRCCGD